MKEIDKASYRNRGGLVQKVRTLIVAKKNFNQFGGGASLEGMLDLT